jgi:lipopolysaccharide transport system permease protein
MTELAKHEPTTVYIKPSRGLAALNLRDLWIYRELVFFMVWRDVKVKYKQTLLGMAWAVVQPVMTMLVFTFVFDRVAKLPTDGLPYEVFSFTALLPWGLFVTALNQGSRSLVAHNNMVTKIYFPRLILPMSSVFAGLVDFAIAFVILIGLMFYYRVMPAWQVLWTLPLFLLLAVVTALGVACGSPPSTSNTVTLITLFRFSPSSGCLRHRLPIRFQHSQKICRFFYPSTQ